MCLRWASGAMPNCKVDFSLICVLNKCSQITSNKLYPSKICAVQTEQKVCGAWHYFSNIRRPAAREKFIQAQRESNLLHLFVDLKHFTTVVTNLEFVSFERQQRYGDPSPVQLSKWTKASVLYPDTYVQGFFKRLYVILFLFGFWPKVFTNQGRRRHQCRWCLQGPHLYTSDAY